MTATSTPHAPRAVLWDLDGTLVDSSAYHREAWELVMADEGVRFTDDDFRRTFGWRNDTILRTVISADIADSEIVRIADAKETAYRDAVRTEGIDLLPGARPLLEALAADGWRQSLASSAPDANIETVLDVAGVEKFFHALASAEDVARGKPAPDIFLRAAQLIGVPHDRCVVVEDAPAGTEGARNAQMACVGVLSTHDHLDADLVVASLSDLTAPRVAKLIRDRG